MSHVFCFSHALRVAALAGVIMLATGHFTLSIAQAEDSTAVSPVPEPADSAVAAPVAPAKEVILKPSVVPSANERYIRQIGGMLEGNYNSAEQASLDKEYLDVRLHIVRIWKDRLESGGLYYYVEQATANALQKPYRQRVYHLHSRHEDGKIECSVYELATPQRLAGQWKDKLPLAKLTPDSLIAREGCGVIIQKDKALGFVGATNGKTCASSQRGATYTTTEMIISPKQLIVWDRGYSAKDEQVWGAKFSGYIFKKENAYTRLPDGSKK